MSFFVKKKKKREKNQIQTNNLNHPNISIRILEFWLSLTFTSSSSCSMENMSVHLLTNSNSILPIANANKILPIDTVPTNNFTDEFLMSHLPNFGRGERITSKDYKFPSFKSFH